MHDGTIHRRAIQLVRVCDKGDLQWETKAVRGTRIRARSNEPKGRSKEAEETG